MAEAKANSPSNKLMLERHPTLHEVLLVSASATDVQIRKFFKKIALLTHPDQGGDEEAFKFVNRAFRVLSDPLARLVYDVDGLEKAEVLLSDN